MKMAKIEIKKCGTFTIDGDIIVEPIVAENVDDAMEVFWSLYVRDEKGLAQCVADRPTQSGIYELHDLLRDAYRE
jgi:hypothetical protein